MGLEQFRQFRAERAERGRFTVRLVNEYDARRWLTFVEDEHPGNTVIAYRADDDVAFALPDRNLPEVVTVVDGIEVTTRSGESATKPRRGATEPEDSGGGSWTFPPTLVSVDVEHEQFLRTLISRVLIHREEGLPVWTPDTWNSWDRRLRAHRAWESVILPAGIAEDFLADLERFVADRALYERRGLPWRRGYLLVGPPGTGKSSIAQAVASKLSYNLVVLTLSALRGDGDLVARFASMPPRSILLLEDLDVQGVNLTRDDDGASENSKITLSAILNSLDGPTTPDGLIVIATSNDPSQLDGALLRKGRFDKRYDLGPVTDNQLVRFLALFYGQAPPVLQTVEGSSLMPAELVELLKLSPTLDDALEALHAHLGDPATPAAA
ncbi:MAG: AAA family ATPase [Actinomycetota bacterium]